MKTSDLEQLARVVRDDRFVVILGFDQWGGYLVRWKESYPNFDPLESLVSLGYDGATPEHLTGFAKQIVSSTHGLRGDYIYLYLLAPRPIQRTEFRAGYRENLNVYDRPLTHDAIRSPLIPIQRAPWYYRDVPSEYTIRPEEYLVLEINYRTYRFFYTLVREIGEGGRRSWRGPNNWFVALKK